MRAKEALNVATEVREFKDGNILVELKAGTPAIDIAEKIKSLTNGTVISKPLQNMVSIEIKNIDPLIDIDELKNDLTRDLKINNVNCVEIKSLNPTCGKHNRL
jgi:sulfate adenylyltransferase subunit 1 (EFTu-like GTPase family)